MAILTTYIQYIEGSSSHFNKKKINKTHPYGKERSKTVFSDKLILCIENSKGSEKKNQEYHLQLISEFSEVT